MSGAELFEELAEQAAPERGVGPGAPRVQVPRRDEPSWQGVDLDALIALDHPAPLGWGFGALREVWGVFDAIIRLVWSGASLLHGSWTHFTPRSKPARTRWAGRRSIRVCCWRCGCMR